MARKKATKKVYDRETSEERIKQAAIALFAEHGFQATTTRMIAEQADSNIALISRYFGNKESLFKTLMMEETGKLLHKELVYPPQDKLDDELRAFILCTLSEISSNISFFRMLVHEAKRSAEYQELLNGIVPNVDPRLLGRLASLQDQNRLEKNCNIEHLAEVTNLFTSGLILRFQIFMSLDADSLETYVNHFIEIVCQKGKP